MCAKCARSVGVSPCVASARLRQACYSTGLRPLADGCVPGLGKLLVRMQALVYRLSVDMTHVFLISARLLLCLFRCCSAESYCVCPVVRLFVALLFPSYFLCSSAACVECACKRELLVASCAVFTRAISSLTATWPSHSASRRGIYCEDSSWVLWLNERN